VGGVKTNSKSFWNPSGLLLFSRRVFRPAEAVLHLLLEQGGVCHSPCGSFCWTEHVCIKDTSAWVCVHRHTCLCTRRRVKHGTGLQGTTEASTILVHQWHNIGVGFQSLCTLEIGALLPKGAVAATELQFCVLHL
jgi:hypothetical protein